MKQRITVEQLNELSPQQKQVLREWWQPQYGEVVFSKDCFDAIVMRVDVNEDDYVHFINADSCKKTDCLPLMSIGQMIQFIKDRGFNIDLGSVPNICDSLWDLVKELLESEVE